MKLVFKLDELVEELGMDVLDTVNGLVVDLVMKVFLRNLLAELLSPEHSFDSLALLQR